jgi:nucleoside-diphosphate-sugar epimerase
MVIPAREGMKTVIEAAVKSRVKKIVVTSSFSTIIGNCWKKELGDNKYSEKDFAPYEGCDGYSKSKIA